MFQTYNSIIINENIDKVFRLTNNLEMWPRFFDEYKEVKILSRIGKKFYFQITNNESQSWRSSRIIDDINYFCAAEREEPMFPFKYMQIIWKYRETDEGTEMIWSQYFEMDEKAPVNGEKAVEIINQHSKNNMLHIKEAIESNTLE
ncbi:MAG: SRPBCC family protein [Bacillota bacterium]|nr:SRPBCC family protein [Bacillota bacterium]